MGLVTQSCPVVTDHCSLLPTKQFSLLFKLNSFVVLHHACCEDASLTRAHICDETALVEVHGQVSVLAGDGQVLQNHIAAARLPPKHAALIWRQRELELTSFPPFPSHI